MQRLCLSNKKRIPLALIIGTNFALKKMAKFAFAK